MLVRNQRRVLELLRNSNIDMIKAQDSKDEDREKELLAAFNGFTNALITVEPKGEEFIEIFLECECGHNFGLTGNETEEELKVFYKGMDEYYDWK